MPSNHDEAGLAALRKFAESVTAKMTASTPGEPEEQLRAPFESLMNELGQAIAKPIICTGEAQLPGRLGKPDFAIHASGLLAGYVELKAPGVGANPTRFKGHNRDQWKRFTSIPNLLYCDGNEWALYRTGERIGKVVRLTGDVSEDAANAVTLKDSSALFGLITDFLSWQPIVPTTSKGIIDLKGMAEILAPLCRLLRQDVADAVKDAQSPLVQLAKDWRQLLFPDADDDQFADAYAQTVTFALLLARSEGADPLTLEQAQGRLSIQHSLLARALQVLTDPQARIDISASVKMLLRVIGAVPPTALEGPEDPWLYFYEDFLAVYDPNLRKDIGAYYTPVEVVHCQVRLIDNLLKNRLGKPMGYADSDVLTLDPAVGTGTYLLGVIEHATNLVEAEQGGGAVSAQATTLANNLYGFEILVGPYAVAEVRISNALESKGAQLPADGTHIYLTDTLESPNTAPPQLPQFLRPIAEQHERALKVKSEVPVIVCLGNPPYDRHDAAAPDRLSRAGGWVRFGDPLEGEAKPGCSRETLMNLREKKSILHKAFLRPTIDAGHGGDLKNAYNLYVYFWRWAIWKVFEQDSGDRPGIVSFISASSYLDGDAFAGMREHMRRTCDEIWIIDLGGEGRGTRKTENVFAIQTPVAIAIAVRSGKPKPDKPANVQYRIISGDKKTKLDTLNGILDFKKNGWQDCPEDWQAPFKPPGEGIFFKWPLLTELLPWQHSGVQFKRTWPISVSPKILNSRWRALLKTEDRESAFKESRDRKIDKNYPALREKDVYQKAISELSRSAAVPEMERYAYRSFDRHWVLADNRLGDFLRRKLWTSHSEKQAYFTTLLNHPLGGGPAITAAALIPDLHHFRGSFGAKEVLPFYNDKDCKEPNVKSGLLETLKKKFNKKITAEQLYCYIYGLLAHPGYTDTFKKELIHKEVRVPITANHKLFEDVRKIGAKLIWYHTYGQRFIPRGRHRGQVPSGKARCTVGIPETKAGYPDKYEYNEETREIFVGEGRFGPVERAVYDFEVSGLKVVQSWLGYRMKNPKGKKSSPLDEIRPEVWTSEFTTEFLELLWVLEATLATYPRQARLLESVCRNKTINI